MNPGAGAELLVGALVDDYLVVAVIARGGMGVVYDARQISNDRRVALKVIAPELAGDVSFRKRFEHESRVALQLEHPNVVPVYATGESEGRLFIAMRFIAGIDLNRVLLTDGQLEAKRAVGIVNQIAAALDAAHGLGVVHRDIKPANVMVERLATDREHCYVMDFGLAKHAASTDVTRSGTWVGTLNYVAPEQIAGGRVDARTDVYSLGAVLFHTLSGRPPFEGHDAAKVYAHVNTPPPDLLEVRPELPLELSSIIARAMSKHPDERYPSAGDLGRAAESSLAGIPPHARERIVATGDAAPAPTVPHGSTPTREGATAPLATAPLMRRTEQREPQRPHRRTRFAVGATSGLVVVAAVLAYVLAQSPSSHKPRASASSTTPPRSPRAAQSGAHRAKHGSPSIGSPHISTTTAQVALPRPLHGGSGTVSWAGEVGPLAFGASRQNDIENAAGKPDATAEGSFELPGFPPYRALGYDCSDAQDTLHRPLVYSTQPPFCATVYYVNASNGLLEAFWSSSPHFKSLQNVSPGMTVARAAVAENQKLTVGCGNPDFTEGGNRYPALVKLETINAAANAHDQGSFQINDITSESNKHGVGLFGC